MLAQNALLNGSYFGKAKKKSHPGTFGFSSNNGNAKVKVIVVKTASSCLVNVYHTGTQQNTCIHLYTEKQWDN